MRRNHSREERPDGSPGNLACIVLALAMVGASWGTSILLDSKDTTPRTNYTTQQSYQPANTNYHGGSLIFTR